MGAERTWRVLGVPLQFTARNAEDIVIAVFGPVSSPAPAASRGPPVTPKVKGPRKPETVLREAVRLLPRIYAGAGRWDVKDDIELLDAKLRELHRSLKKGRR